MKEDFRHWQAAKYITRRNSDPEFADPGKHGDAFFHSFTVKCTLDHNFR